MLSELPVFKWFPGLITTETLAIHPTSVMLRRDNNRWVSSRTCICNGTVLDALEVNV